MRDEHRRGVVVKKWPYIVIVEDREIAASGFNSHFTAVYVIATQKFRELKEAHRVFVEGFVDG